MTNRTQHFQTLFMRHYRQMYRLAILFLHDDAESKDVVHDIFAQLLADSRDVREDTAEAFLLTCVRNRCMNVIRNRKIQERIARLYMLDTDIDTTPAKHFAEELDMLTEGISRLTPPVCREIIELHFRDGHTFRDIAQQLGVSETTVYKHLRNALNQLRKHINND